MKSEYLQAHLKIIWYVFCKFAIEIQFKAMLDLCKYSYYVINTISDRAYLDI